MSTLTVKNSQGQKTWVNTFGKRIGNDVFEGEVTVTLRGACSRTFSWDVVNRLPDREGSIMIMVGVRDLISFRGDISNEKVEKLSPSQQFFFHLVVGEVNELIKALSAQAHGGVAQLVGSRESPRLACIKEKPTGKVGDGTSRVVELDLDEKELGFLADMITQP
ncbi:MAG: hypothetical protein NUV54_00520 [Candidatus Taylorbacteria bacterium]|nr:hypothetical protein [Candidatus Taylorbacteria bacterium]